MIVLYDHNYDSSDQNCHDLSLSLRPLSTLLTAFSTFEPRSLLLWGLYSRPFFHGLFSQAFTSLPRECYRIPKHHIAYFGVSYDGLGFGKSVLATLLAFEEFISIIGFACSLYASDLGFQSQTPVITIQPQCSPSTTE